MVIPKISIIFSEGVEFRYDDIETMLIDKGYDVSRCRQGNDIVYVVLSKREDSQCQE